MNKIQSETHPEVPLDTNKHVKKVMYLYGLSFLLPWNAVLNCLDFFILKVISARLTRIDVRSGACLSVSICCECLDYL